MKINIKDIFNGNSNRDKKPVEVEKESTIIKAEEEPNFTSEQSKICLAEEPGSEQAQKVDIGAAVEPAATNVPAEPTVAAITEAPIEVVTLVEADMLAVPSEPVAADIPVEPDTPIVPEKSVPTDTAVELDKPDTPAEPGEPIEDVEVVTSDATAQPVVSDTPATAEEPTEVAASATDEKPARADTVDEPAADDTPDTPVEPLRAPLHERLRNKFDRKYGWIAAIAASFVILLLATFAYTNMVPREIHATINGENYVYTSTAYTVEGFLEDWNIDYCDEDYLSTPPTTFIYDGIKFCLNHAVDFTVTADGKTTKHKTLENTVEDALKDREIKVGKLDIVTPSPETALKDEMQVLIQRVTIKEITAEEEVAFKTVNKDDASMNEGTTKVVTKGKNGKDRVTYSIKYIDGVKTSKKEIARKTVTPMVNKVVANGTRINLNGISYSKKLTVKAYAYTGGGRTAMGTRARVGEIAVDPGVIPLGSTVYIEGVGVRRAEDTGGNIKGNTIDIYMNSNSQCISWGVRYVTIYIQ